MICNKCNNDLKSEDKFCPQCGERVVKAADCYKPPCALDHGTPSSERVSDHGMSSSEGVPGEMSPDELKKRLSNFENEKVNFGIIGESAAGKSSFINLFFDLAEGDENYAKVGDGNTTTEPTKYFHPASDKITITDMPGISAMLTRDKFLRMVNLSYYHFFFIFFKDVLSDTDLWIAKQLMEKNIPFSIVRAKIDEYVLGEKKKGQNESTVIEDLRHKLITSHKRIEIFKHTNLYLISNIKKFFYLGDFVRLVADIASMLPDAKAEAFLLFLPVLSPRVIELKYESLLKRIPFVSALSGGVAAIPVPFLDIPVCLAILSKEIRRYATTFQLDEAYAKNVPNLKHGMFKRTEENRAFKTKWEFIATQSLSALSKIGLALAVSQIDVVIPVVGSVIAACGNYKLVGSCLLSNLNELKSDALTVNSHYMNLYNF